ncbi:MAG: glycosyltransferase family 4 protein [Candidatus Hermodarchaeota archaeon]
MIKVNFLSEFLMFKRIIGVNGALNATLTQADELKRFVNVVFNQRGKDFDLTHSHGCFPLTYHMMKKSSKLKKPIVISAHQTHYDTDNAFLFSKQISLLFKIYLRRYFKFADKVICPTEYSKNIVKTELRFDKPIELVSNGVNTQIFKHSPQKRAYFRESYNLEDITIMCVGMPIERKGFYDFIRISRRMKKHPFIWVGRRAFPLIQQDLNYNLNNLIMPGYVEDIIAAYSGGDIFCFPSYYEGEGIAILEAMSCGLPVVLRDLPTYNGRFIDGENCLKARDNNEFIEKISYLINQPKERKRIALNGFNTAKKLDIEETAKSIYEIYKDLL